MCLLYSNKNMFWKVDFSSLRGICFLPTQILAGNLEPKVYLLQLKKHLLSTNGVQGCPSSTISVIQSPTLLTIDSKRLMFLASLIPSQPPVLSTPNSCLNSNQRAFVFNKKIKILLGLGGGGVTFPYAPIPPSLLTGSCSLAHGSQGRASTDTGNKDGAETG